MRRVGCVLVVVLALCGLSRADAPVVDGSNDILAVVNGEPVTYQQIVGGLDMQTEINTWRNLRGIPPSTTDADIERVLVYQRLQSFVLQRLLDAEAERVNLRIPDSQMRGILRRERRSLNIPEDDTRAWADFLKTRYGMTPSEYRERRRGEIMRSEMLRYMAGVYGPLPPQWPIETYYSLSVTPREVRRAFDAQRNRWRVARNIDYRVFRLLYPQDIDFDDRAKLYHATDTGENSVYERVLRGESMEAATTGLRQLIEDLAIPGLRLEITPREVIPDDAGLDPTVYDMVLQPPTTGGLSELGSASETDDAGTNYEGFMFVQLFSREDGTARAFEDIKVQEGIREAIFSRRLQENQQKVQNDLLRRAAIVPQHLFPR